MKTNKKTLIILASVAALILVGLAVSQFANWDVDSDGTSGNIAKSSRFSRKTAEEGASNMQELLLSDENYKDGIVAAYLVMKTRARQFNSLVDMSVDVAGGIPEFEDLLKDMQDTKPMVNNVITSMDAAGNDLNAALGGESPKELAQNTTNATLAYAALQKQNGVADRFIDTADAYLKTAAGNDRLKLVRDQWMDYQQLTAVLMQDEEAAAALQEKGYLLTAEQGAAALGSFSQDCQMSVLCNAAMSEMMGAQIKVLASNVMDSAISDEALKALRSQTEEVLGQAIILGNQVDGAADGAVASLSNQVDGAATDAVRALNNQVDGAATDAVRALNNQVDGAATDAVRALNNQVDGAAGGAVASLNMVKFDVLLSAMAGMENLQVAALPVLSNAQQVVGMTEVPLGHQVTDALNAMAGESAESLRFF